MFILNSKDLNQKQINAINEENSLLLVACPGSGKTRTLTYKIATELTKIKNHHQYIIAITYTNNAADEIKERIELLGVDTSQLWIGTIHSFCLEWILRPYSLYLPRLKKGFRVINSHDTEEIITNLCNQFNSDNRLSGRNRITYWNFEYYATAESKIRIVKKDSKTDNIKKIFKQYLTHLKENHQIEFEQILLYSLKILKEKPVINSILNKIFSYILVDEYQDTKNIQYHILASILNVENQNTKLFIVGDPNQSIFQSLGGFPMKKDELEELTNLRIEKMSLTDNYRSSNKIVEYFDYYKTFETEIKASGVHRGHSSVITFDDTVQKNDLEETITELIKENIEEKSISQNEICILAPWWINIISLTRKLMVQLPEYSFDGPGLAPFVRDIDNFWYKLSKIILTQASPRSYIRRMRWAKEVLKELDNIGIDISEISNKKLLRICNSIDINETDGLKYLEEFFYELFKQLLVDFKKHKMLIEHYEAFFDSSKARIERLKRDGIDYAGDISTFKKVFDQKEGITISTIHGAKGLEFDTVIAISLLEGMIPHFNDSNKEDSAKKQLYVIASRARKNLHLISERGRMTAGYKPQEYQITNVLDDYNYSYD
ncbi:UvrD-helicase domain-containing protein [Poseidonibacter ostreae]|uniref:DNA 3'-5' helicase n=1 Tax=Poseidonibacter ostreae TaxID=2654171 RepID=A0A6L4WW77_9BACT|nr:ATP-dependent helicase [Poseidonibacter ostreae]KAB7890294.1 AAA family ATPase [Poseidonibacter ostreae]